jgi:hypothetical protein
MKTQRPRTAPFVGLVVDGPRLEEARAPEIVSQALETLVDPVTRGDPQLAVFVSPWTFDKFGQTPHVNLSLSPHQEPVEYRENEAQLAPSDARRLAIALLQAAGTAEHSN